MIIFLYGPDDYRRHQKSKEIIEEYKKRHPNFVLQFFNLEEENEFLKLQEFNQNRSFFEEIKMAVLENYFVIINKEKKEFLKNAVDKKDLILLISENKQPLKEFKFLLEKPVQFQEFKSFNSAQLTVFIKKEAKNRKLNLSDEAVLFLKDVFDDDIWGLINELDKLALIKKPKLEIADIEEHSDVSLPCNIFTFINNFNSQQISKNLFFLEMLFFNREEPAKIFNFLAASKRKTKDLTEKLARYDVLVKLGKLGYEEVLLDLALS